MTRRERTPRQNTTRFVIASLGWPHRRPTIRVSDDFTLILDRPDKRLTELTTDYDYLEPRYYIDQVLASKQIPSFAELEAGLSLLCVDTKTVENPLSLEDDTGTMPTAWGVQRGPDSGYQSWEPLGRRAGQQLTTLPAFAADVVEVYEDGRCPPPSMPATLTWMAEDEALMLNGLTETGPSAYPPGVDNDYYNIDFGSDDEAEG